MVQGVARMVIDAVRPFAEQVVGPFRTTNEHGERYVTYDIGGPVEEGQPRSDSGNRFDACRMLTDEVMKAVCAFGVSPNRRPYLYWRVLPELEIDEDAGRVRARCRFVLSDKPPITSVPLTDWLAAQAEQKEVAA